MNSTYHFSRFLGAKHKGENKGTIAEMRDYEGYNNISF